MLLKDKIKSGVYFIAEMSANHAGSLENALKIVKAAKEAGADCLKVQTYTADTLTLNCNKEYFQIKGGLWDGKMMYELYKEAYTPWEWQPLIKEECEKLKIDFLSTPFDNTAVDFLESIGVQAYKIASYELVDIPLIKYVASKGKLVIISCGMGSIEEIQEAVDSCRKMGNEDIILLKCCSEYPANWSDMNLDVIVDMRNRFNLPIGVSDHSTDNLAAIVGATLGACIIEKHFCLSRSLKNPDSEFSVEPDEFSNMVRDVNNALLIKGQRTYNLTEAEKKATKDRRSIFASKDIRKGELFTKENIRIVRPGYGALPKFFSDFIDSKSKKDIEYGEPVFLDDINNG